MDMIYSENSVYNNAEDNVILSCPLRHDLFLLVPSECQVPGADLEINPTLESLCLSMTEHALGGECKSHTCEATASMSSFSYQQDDNTFLILTSKHTHLQIQIC